MVWALIILGGVIVVGVFKWLLSNNGGAGCTDEVDCIRYSDILTLRYGDKVEKMLATNPSLRLAARKRGVAQEGKTMTQVDVEWYDSGARRFKPMSPPWSRVSERLDEELAAKFGPSSVIFVGE